MLHQWCFETTNPKVSALGINFEISIFTETNRFDLDPNKTTVDLRANSVIVDAKGLTWAGGQVVCEGEVYATIVKTGEKFRVDIRATKLDEPVRKVKFTLHNRQFGEVIARRRYNVTPDIYGTIFNYPNGWDDLFTPLIVVSGKDGFDFYRSLDTIVRPKHFVTTKVGEGLDVEMVYEEDAGHNLNTLEIATFEFGKAPSVEAIFEEQRKHIERAYGLTKWEFRKDVPAWAKRMSLIISLHGMHWSGHIFNTYKQMEEKLEWFAGKCDPESTCVYIPGFDGRYYWDYPNYDPDGRMGGEAGLKHLIDKAHMLGYHVMPMFMINGANPRTPGFEEWGECSRYYSRNNQQGGVGSCDWDTGRTYDLSAGIAMNPGAPKWQDHFVEEASKQIRKYGFDAIFLDLAAIYWNDPRHNTHEGATAIINRLHEEFPNLLIATEGCYDGLSTVFPLSQCAGEGSRGLEMIYHDTPYAPLFDTYNRFFGHLCMGAPGNGKVGVFESGFNYVEWKLPLRKGAIPTVTVVDDTIEVGEEGILEILKDAEEYKKRFLNK